MSGSFVQFQNTHPNPGLSNVQDVPPDEVSTHSEALCLIDVRQPEEYTGPLGHIPGSTLIPLATLPEKLSELPKDKTIVFVCRSGGRSAGATGMALDSGFQHVFNMKGGMILWNENGLATNGKSE